MKAVLIGLALILILAGCTQITKTVDIRYAQDGIKPTCDHACTRVDHAPGYSTFIFDDGFPTKGVRVWVGEREEKIRCDQFPIRTLAYMGAAVSYVGIPIALNAVFTGELHDPLPSYIDMRPGTGSAQEQLQESRGW